MHEQIPPRNRAERRAAARQRRGKTAATALTASKVGAMVATTAAAAFVVGSAPAGANAPIVVSNTNDAGAGSLRQAVIDSQDGAHPGADTITFAPGVTGNITLTGGQLDTITEPLTITGPGASALSVTGTGTDRIFALDTGGGAAFDATISGLTLTHDGGTVDGDGGAINNAGAHLTLADDVLTANHASAAGGAVASRVDGNQLVLQASTLSNNTADGNGPDAGGAAYVAGAGAELDVMSSTVTGNTTAEDWAGGLYYYGSSGVVQIVDSTISDNTAAAGGGGGWLGGDNAQTTIRSSTISGNHANGSNGGGLGLYTDGVTVSDTVVSGNQSDSRGGGLYLEHNDLGVTIDNTVVSGNSTNSQNGGGISLYGATAPVTITNTTISGNTAARGGGGVYTSSDGDGVAPISIYNSTISGNQALDGWGGGLYTGFESAPVSIFNSTISGNTAAAEGGGVSFNGYYGLVLVQTTITDNTATTFGGLYLPEQEQFASAQARHAAKHADAGAQAENRPGHRSEGQAVHSSAFPELSSGETTSTGTIIAGNQGTDIGPGATVHSDHSLIGTVAPGTTIDDVGGTLLGVDPMLGPLTNNGGPTETHALLTGSPAINASTNPVASFTGNAYDQRGPGFARVVDGVADIGAFEVQPPAAPAPASVLITPKFTG
jgi:hypothetical protein